MTFTISLVQYLNSAPLGWGFTHGPLHDRAGVVLSTPAQCADQLRDGQVDAGLIPVAEYQRIPGLQIVPGVSIATQSKARTVLLVSRVPPEKIRTLALDDSSRTSAVLVQVLLAEVFDVVPEITRSGPDIKEMLSRHDAALIIGDPALAVSGEGVYVHDLGEMWVRRTGLPFVFAFWAVRPSAEARAMAPLFSESKSFGLAHLDDICRQYALQVPLSIDEIRDYLTVNLDFDLGARHQDGLNLFFESAFRRGLLPAMRPLEFVSF